MAISAIDACWSREKLARALAHVSELEQAMSGWVDPVRHSLDIVLADDGWKVEATFTLWELPPLSRWALIIGDCVHNIRTALDVFVWENSVELPETKRRAAAYPILQVNDDIDDDEAVPHRLENQPTRDRKRIARQVEGLREPLRSRVIGNMRWASFMYEGDLVWHQQLPLIRALDDADKHRIALKLVAVQNEATWDVWGMDLGGAPAHISVDWNHAVQVPSSVGERVVIATGTPEKRIAEIDGTASIVLGIRVEVEDRWLRLPETLRTFIEDVGGLLDVLCEDIPLN